MKDNLLAALPVNDQERAGAGSLAALSDADLLIEVARLASREHAATADLVQALSEIDARKLYLREGCASLFTYCTERLHLSEHAAYRRIEAARLARRSPLVLERLREGALTLTAASLLAPHLTEANCREVLDAARHKSKRVVEGLVTELRPQPDVPTSIRRLPAPPSAPQWPRPARWRGPTANTANSSIRAGAHPTSGPLSPRRPATVRCR
jgi:hypothetical protein